jgi:1,2-diacylglycerol 3-beta-glucosyltransferase
MSVLAVTLVLAGSIATLYGLYLLLLSTAALFHSESTQQLSPTARLAVLVPAHDEAAVIARCVRSLRAQSYPRHLYQIVVVADNCTDDTAAIAAQAGAHRVMTRYSSESGGKGGALRWALDQILVGDAPPTAVAIVDADSIPPPGFLTALVQPFEAKRARVVQGLSLLSPQGSDEASLGVMAFMLFNRVRPTGRAVLHLRPINLVGNGMLLDRRVLLEHPWDAFTSSEDLEYSLTLHLARERVEFAPSAVLPTPPAPNADAARQQQLRWHGGRAHLSRVWIPRLVKRAVLERRPSLLGVALGLGFPPLGLLTAATIAGVAINLALAAGGLAPWWSSLPWCAALAAIASSVLVGLRACDTPPAGYRALLRAPLYVGSAVLGARRVLTFRGDTWVRAER